MKATPQVLGRETETEDVVQGESEDANDAEEHDPASITEVSQLTFEEARAPGRRALDSKPVGPGPKCIVACFAVLAALLLSVFALLSFVFGGPDAATLLPPTRTESCKHMELVPQGVGSGDGVWPVCADYLPSTDCVVYTAGARDDVRFEVGMVRRGCEVHAFDPALQDIESWVPETIRIAEQSGVHFHPWALGGVDAVVEAGKMPYTWPGMGYGQDTNSKPWNVKTLRGLMETFNRTKIDVLKVDVEGAEWLLLEAALKDPISRGALESGRVRQIIMEAHFMPPRRNRHARSPRHPQDWEARNLHFRDLLQELEKLGYRLFWREPSPGERTCHRVGLVWQGGEGAR